MRQKRVIVAVVAAILVLSMSVVALAGGKTTKKDVIWPADAIKWEDGPLKGTHVAKLWGEWMKGGPYGVLIKFDAGLMNPLHKHTQTLKIVVLSGTFIHHPDGGVEAKLVPALRRLTWRCRGVATLAFSRPLARLGAERPSRLENSMARITRRDFVSIS